MDEQLIKQFCHAVGKWCWDNDFTRFCEATGFTGDYASSKWFALQRLRLACEEFDADTLARILNS